MHRSPSTPERAASVTLPFRGNLAQAAPQLAEVLHAPRRGSLPGLRTVAARPHYYPEGCRLVAQGLGGRTAPRLGFPTRGPGRGSPAVRSARLRPPRPNRGRRPPTTHSRSCWSSSALTPGGAKGLFTSGGGSGARGRAPALPGRPATRTAPPGAHASPEITGAIVHPLWPRAMPDVVVPDDEFLPAP